jgi:hypothetical protein
MMPEGLSTPSTHGWPFTWDEGSWERLANFGGPRSRRRTERLSATVLGRDDGAVRCPRVLRIGLDFGKRNPLTCARELLKTCGFADEQEACAAIALPDEPCICRPDPGSRPAQVETLPPSDALYQALILGLCTPYCYDPGRAVLWTNASLTRRLELFDGRGFYA